MSVVGLSAAGSKSSASQIANGSQNSDNKISDNSQNSNNSQPHSLSSPDPQNDERSPPLSSSLSFSSGDDGINNAVSPTTGTLPPTSDPTSPPSLHDLSPSPSSPRSPASAQSSYSGDSASTLSESLPSDLDDDDAATQDPPPPGLYPLIIGHWMIPNTGPTDQQHVVYPLIDARQHLQYRIQALDSHDAPLALPNRRGGTRVSEADLQWRRPAAGGYFQYAAQYWVLGGDAGFRARIMSAIARHLHGAARAEQQDRHAGSRRRHARGTARERAASYRRAALRRELRHATRQAMRRANRRVDRREARLRERRRMGTIVRTLNEETGEESGPTYFPPRQEEQQETEQK